MVGGPGSRACAHWEWGASLSPCVADIAAQLADALRDRYVLGRELGHGGMATVYLAHDVKHQRPVALKVLRPELGQLVGPDRFRREITTAARLQHPHILSVHDSGETAGQLWFTMPFVEGESLRHRLRRDAQLAVEDALRITVEIGRALDYAHRHGVIHRDIKPENILLTADGDTLLADFGVAYALGPSDTGNLTQIGLAVGTPTYMAPEQAMGERALDGRVDQYALAVTCFELLAGMPPFVGATPAALIAQRLGARVPSVRAARPEVSASVDAALQRALSVDPEARFGSMPEFLRALVPPEGERTKVVPASAPVAAPAGKSVAVLPFANRSHDADSEFFSDGMTDDLIGALARIPGLHVVSRTSVFAFKGRNEDVRIIGERLNVQAVLEGSVRRVGPRLRVTAQLVNVADGFHLWSETYDRQVEDVFAIQDEITGAIAGALEVQLLGRSGVRRRPPTEDLEAYSLYLRGRYHWNRRTEDAVRTGLGFFEQALARDPSYAPAHAGVADSYIILGFYCAIAPGDAFSAGKAASRRALELDPDLAEARAALGFIAMYYDWDWVESERNFRDATRLNPGYATAHQWYGALLGALGRFDESFESFGKAIALDPLSPLRLSARGWGAYFAGRYDDAVQYELRSLALDPDYVVAHLWLGVAQLQTGACADAIATFERAVLLSGRNVTALAMLGHARAVGGDPDGARSLLRELDELRRVHFVSPVDLAAIHVGLGNLDVALDWLERGFDERTHWMALLGVEARFNPLRRMPRFLALLDRMRLHSRQ
jgi:serine/threonine protein kinase/tetratricopeptide (TPR) repeat protein